MILKFINRGAAKDMIMDPAGSIKDYDKAIQLDPDYSEAYANRGVAKINLLRKNGSIQGSRRLGRRMDEVPTAQMPERWRQLYGDTINLKLINKELL
jgi:hypothetical protein